MIRAGIIGGSGYTGGELIRLLVNHPKVEIDFVYSRTKSGKKISVAHADLLGTSDLAFTDSINPEVDILFLCLGHGNSKSFLSEYSFSSKTKIVDLSNDFRLMQDASFGGKDFIYGLPELNKNTITSAEYIANPGCFATCIQLALLPLADAKLLNSEVHINAVTGSTGAGVMPSPTTHFSWRNNNASWYKAFTHQHLGEINESLGSLQEDIGELFFIPNRGNFSRGILSTAYTRFEGSDAEASDLYHEFYKDAVFTQISEDPVHLKQVVNTNNCHIHLHKHKNILLITSVIDNLLKGASGQAVQNMNLMFGFDESRGLNLKATVY
jgi:N-acetyl-gamma-glutamyl-phosphate reductase